MAEELHNLEKLAELLQKRQAADASVQENQRKLGTARGKDKKRKAKLRLEDATKDLEELQMKVQDLRRIIQDSWSGTKRTVHEQRSIPDEVEVDSDDSQISYSDTEPSKAKQVVNIKPIKAVTSPASRGLRLPKPDKYKRGENFTRFCDNFQDYVRLGEIKSDDLNLYFLGLVDDFTKDKLKKITLTSDQRGDAGRFIPIFIEKMTPRHEADNLKLKLCDLRQEKRETPEDFAYKLREISSRAYGAGPDEEATMLASCYAAFIKGLSSQEIRIKLRENTNVTGFDQAVEEACRLQDIRDSESHQQGIVETNSTDHPHIEILKIQNDSGTATDDRHPRSSYRREDTGDERYRRRSSSNNSRNNYNNTYRRPDAGNTSYRRNNDSQNSQKNGPRDNESRDDSTGAQYYKNSRTIICHKCHQPNHKARYCTLNE